MNRPVVRGCLLLLACILWAQTTPSGVRRADGGDVSLWGDLAPGKYGVGFRVKFLSDPGRSFAVDPASQDARKAPRQLRVFVWYPAKVNAPEVKMQFGDYFESQAPSADYEQLNELLRARDQRTLGRQFTQKNAPELVARLRAVPVAAVMDAPPARGRFPLVLHSLGRNDYQHESTVLWEYLASHGFVVAVLPQLGKSLAQPQLSFTVSDLRIQQADIDFSWRALATLPFVDMKKTALLGHSSGGVAAMMVAAGNPKVQAVVSLDGSISTPDGVRLLSEAKLDPVRIAVPLLNLHKLVPKNSLDAAFINSLAKARVVNIGFRPATHFDFQNWPLYSLLASEEDERSRNSRPAASGRAVFWTVCEVTHLFLKATLRGEKRAWKELQAPPARLPAGDVLFSEGTWKLPQ